MYFSIIIPSLNEGKLIEKTLKLLKKQTFKDYEIIVKDGGSTDNTVAIAKKYADKVLVGKDISIGDGRNKAIKVAKGKILFFLDADTWVYDKNYLKKAKEVFDKDQKLLGIGEAFEYDDDKSKLYMPILNLLNNVLAVLLKKALIPTTVCMFRKESVKKVGYFDASLKCTEDFDLSIKINKLGKVRCKNIGKVVSSYRRMRKYGIKKTIDIFLKNTLRPIMGKRVKMDWEKMGGKHQYLKLKHTK